MPIYPNARLELDTEVPAGSTLLGLYPQQLFRTDRIETKPALGVCLIRGGMPVPLDGQTHEIEGHERTLCLGSFVALHVHNDTGGPARIQLVLHGVTVDGDPNVAASVERGFFVAETDYRLKREREERTGDEDDEDDDSALRHTVSPYRKESR